MAVEEIGRLRTIAIVGQGGDRQDPVGRGDAVHRRRDSPGWGGPTTARRQWTSSPKSCIGISRSAPPFIIYNWKKTEVIVADTPGYHGVSARRFRDDARR